MSRPGEDLCGTLSYRPEPTRSPRLSLYHLKLTDSALRCLRDFQRGQGSGSSLSQPLISFQGNQGYIKIPSPIPGSNDRVRIFSFYLSRESKEKPQSSFECIRQGTSWSGEKQLSCIGSIQDKITICATEESYQLTRDRMSQVEKETWSWTAIEIKPGASYRSKCVKIPSKNSVEVGKEDSPSRRRPAVFLTPAAKKCNRVYGEHRPLQEWLIHLLALKPHRKQDLILRLEKGNALPRDHTELMSMLHMVGRLSSKDGCYSLREELYCQVQKEWTGYTLEEKQRVADILSRKRPNSSSRNCLTTNASAPPNRVRPPETKRPAPEEATEDDCRKRMRGSHSESQQTTEKYSDSQHSNMDCSQPTIDAKGPCSVPGNNSIFLPQSHKKNQSTHRSLRKNQQREMQHGTKPGNVAKTDKAELREARSQARKEKDSSEEEEEEEDDWEEEALLLERCLCRPEEKEQCVETSLPSEEIPDYLKKYNAITSEDQRKLYEEDFESDYTEYLQLHSKIGKVLERFDYLGSKMKKLQPGTVEHKMIEKKILNDYKKFKKTYPGYSDDKIRCEYLHHKLSHIKQMILEYEKNMPT
ncbi:RNA polymerase II elongation factor ELL3 [Spea bombifrons]|uniref:RNA polymerase II elongation factor ELL3 n=1 Tax=Spea bombifrons TaxID=233779 RepID=UPI00234B9C62|nr:RNA polymerase II elongation factor ELL3 [Spea bombifrons]